MKTLRVISWVVMGVIIGAILMLMFRASICNAMEVGVIADIHAGKEGKRKAGSSIVYPKLAINYFEKALKEMQGKVDIVLVLGDNTNRGKKKYYKRLKKVENKYNMRVLWVKGNHDNKNFRYLYDKTNYYVDFGDIRIVVLDTNTGDVNGNGGINSEGLVLYREVSKTDKKVVVAMHHPPMNKATKTCDWNSAYDWVKDADLILSGHWHKEITCGNTMVFSPLSEHKRLTYRIISL
jgi:predicted phosphodiesterase